MTADLFVRDCRVVKPDAVVACGLAIRDGVIQAVLAPGERVDARRQIDAGGRPVLPGLLDTHVHLGDAQFDADRAEVLARAAEKGVTRLVEIADAPSEWEAAVALSRARPAMVRCALGLHPYYAAQFGAGFLEELERKARLPEVVAVGEIGLDYVKAEAPASVQREAFEKTLAACKAWAKPAVIHCRGAYEDLNAIVAELFPEPPRDRRFWGVVHCFSGTPADAAFLAARASIPGLRSVATTTIPSG